MVSPSRKHLVPIEGLAAGGALCHGRAVIMADTKPSEASKAPSDAKTEPARTEQKSQAQAAPQQSAQPRQGNSGQSQEPGENLAQALQDAHTARTTVPGAPGVDARLDNRTGAARPPLEEWPAKPQQVDGPDLAHQAEHTAATLRNLDQEVGDRKGMYSPGPHGLSDEELRESGTAFGPEGLAEAGPGSKG